MNLYRVFLPRICLIAGLALLPLWLGCDDSRSEVVQGRNGALGKVAAPDLALTCLNGQKLRLSDYRGKVVVLNFWGTWCPPCRFEIPHFVDLYRSYKDKDVMMIGIAVNEVGPEHVRAFTERYGISYPIAVVSDYSEIERSWAAVTGIPTVQGLGGGEPEMGNGSFQYLPTTFIIDKAGNIYRKHVGPRERRHLEPELKKLLGLDHEGDEAWITKGTKPPTATRPTRKTRSRPHGHPPYTKDTKPPTATRSMQKTPNPS